MADYPINKGIGHSVEFKGLKHSTSSSLQVDCLPSSSLWSSSIWLVRINWSASAWVSRSDHCLYGEHSI